MGFTPDLVAGVRIGFDDYSPLGPRETGAVAALPTWISFMQAALGGRPAIDFELVPGVEQVRIDAASGKLARPEAPNAPFVPFLSGTAPTETASTRARQRTAELLHGQPLRVFKKVASLLPLLAALLTAPTPGTRTSAPTALAQVALDLADQVGAPVDGRRSLAVVVESRTHPLAAPLETALSQALSRLGYSVVALPSATDAEASTKSGGQDWLLRVQAGLVQDGARSPSSAK